MIKPALLCDTCPNVFITERNHASNSYLTRAAIAAGWTITKSENGWWLNECDECRTTDRKDTTT
ncbi:hypothetical protein RN51_03324 [Microbacterium oxydans]|uniref:Uncharacterized protein n=1 Tax=Microbacterium oxydans TaxID=82380 RepID=A0A0F0KEA7_9MICO|nr:hypothetical protein RN51_03324 [Microbacterium oxydans]